MLDVIIGSIAYKTIWPVILNALKELPGGVAESIITDRADNLACAGVSRLLRHIKERNTSEPIINHELLYAARLAYLQATLELVQESIKRGPSHAVLFNATAPLKDVIVAIQTEIGRPITEAFKDLNRATPATRVAATNELDLFLATGNSSAGERVKAFRGEWKQVLVNDFDRWGLPLNSVPVVEQLLTNGWTNEGGDRDWLGVMALWFMDAIKSQSRLSAIFQAQVLAEIKNREPSIDFPLQFERFARQFGDAFGTIGRLEAKIDRLPKDLADALTAVIEWKSAANKPQGFTRLGVRPQPFVGRTKYLRWLHDSLAAQPGECLLFGEPGTGKSSLALEFGWQELEQFDAVVLQRCGERSVDVIGLELARHLPIDATTLSPEQQVERALEWLRSRRSLLVLDDVSSQDVRSLHPGGRVSVLVTARSRHVWPVPERQVLHVEGLSKDEAAELFRDYLPARWDDHINAVVNFAEKVEFLPYALAVSVQMLGRTIDAPLDALGRLSTATLRNATLDLPALLRAAIADHSAEGRLLLQAISICASSGAWLPLVAEIAGLSEDEAREQATALTNSSLLRLQSADTLHFGMHSTLRELLASEPGSEQLRIKHAIAVAEAFDSWETHWQPCINLVDEVEPSLTRLWENTPAAAFDFALAAMAHAERIGHWERALRIAAWVQAANEGQHPSAPLATCLGFQVRILTSRGNAAEALPLLNRAKEISSRLGDQTMLASCLCDEAGVCEELGQSTEALALFERAEAIYRDLGNRERRARCLRGQAGILLRWERRSEAWRLLKRAEQIAIAQADRLSLATCHEIQSSVLEDWGRPAEALKLLGRAAELAAELGDRRKLANNFSNQAVSLWNMNQHSLAADLFDKADRLFGELGDRQRQAACLVRRAMLLGAAGNRVDAQKFLEKAESILQEVGDQKGLASCYGGQAGLLRAAGRLPEAMILLDKQIKLLVGQGDRSLLAGALGNRVLCLMEDGQRSEALSTLEEQERICTDLGDRRMLAECWGRKAMIYLEQEDFERCFLLLDRQEEMLVRLQDRRGLAMNYGDRGMALALSGRRVRAMVFLSWQEAIFLDVNEREELARCSVKQALVLGAWGRSDDARRHLTAALRIFEELGRTEDCREVELQLNFLTRWRTRLSLLARRIVLRKYYRAYKNMRPPTPSAIARFSYERTPRVDEPLPEAAPESEAATARATSERATHLEDELVAAYRQLSRPIGANQ